MSGTKRLVFAWASLALAYVLIGVAAAVLVGGQPTTRSQPDRRVWYDAPSPYQLAITEEKCAEEHGGRLGAVVCPVIGGAPVYCRARCDVSSNGDD